MRVWSRTKNGRRFAPLVLLAACSVGDDDDNLYSAQTSAASMFSSGGEVGEESSVTGGSDSSGADSDDTQADTSGDPGTDSTSDPTTTDPSTSGDGDSSDPSTSEPSSTGDGDGDGDSTTDSTTDPSTTGDGDGDGGTTTGSASCGDGVLDAGEECDDNNTSSNDGCSDACAWETDCQNDNPHPAITCSLGVSGNMNGAWSDVENPLCGETFLYQDQVMVFTPTTSSSVTATFTANADQGNGAIFVMEGSCHTQLCMASSLESGDYHSLTFEAIAGTTYYLNLELPSAQPNFTVNLSCQ